MTGVMIGAPGMGTNVSQSHLRQHWVISSHNIKQTIKKVPYFTDYRSMRTIGRIAAFQLNFMGNTKIGRIP
jgi:hypothetical protein